MLTLQTVFTSCDDSGSEGGGNTNYSYTVTFDSQGADVEADPAVIIVESPDQTIAELPLEPVKTGHTFAGWFTEINGSGSEFTVSTAVTADITVYANWSLNPVYTVTYDSDGGTSVGEQHVTLPETNVVTLPAPPTRTGHTFAGWFTEINGSGSEFTASTPVTADITVYANWSLNPVYTVTYDSDGGTSVSEQHVTLPETSVVTLPAPPTRTGHTFAGWFTGKNGSGSEFTASTPVTADIMVYAYWNANTYTVTFDSQGADVEADPASVAVTFQDVVSESLPTEPVKTGYEFAGWSTEINGGGTEFTKSTPVTTGITVYAMWSTPGLDFTLINSDTEYSVTKGSSDTNGSVSIPGYWQGVKVTAIGNEAFNGCSSLTSLKIPDSVTSIGDYAFYDCIGLTSLTIPGSVTSIGEGAFVYCSGLTSLTIPGSVTSIGEYAFFGCSGLTSLTIPGSVTSIGDEAFSGCSGLTSLTIPDSVTSIGNYAFGFCSGLTDLTISDSVTSIGEEVFYECIGLTSLTIPGSVTSIGEKAFFKCSGLTSLTILGSVTSIRKATFAHCTSLTSLTIPDGVTSIEDSAFGNCSSLTNLTIPGSVTSIGGTAFMYCSSLANLTIPGSVTFIGGWAFDQCSGLTSLSMESTIAPTLGTNPFTGVSGCTLHIYSDATGYDTFPWTTTSIFSSVVSDL